MSFIFLLRYFFLFCFVLLVLKGAPTGAAGWVNAQVTNEIKNEKKIASAATEGRSNLCERLVKKT